MSLNQVDTGLALSNAAIQTTVGIAVAVAVHWLLAKHLWKRRCETPHEVGYWASCWVGCLQLGLSVGKFTGQALYGRVTDNDLYLLLMNGVVVAFVYGLFAYCAGWIYGRLFRSTKTITTTTLTAPVAHVPSGSEQSTPHRVTSTQTYPSASAVPEPTTLSEEELYEQVLNEITDGSKRLGLWAMALEQTAQGGSTEGAYIALRVKQLKAERQANLSAQQAKTNDDKRNAAVAAEASLQSKAIVAAPSAPSHEAEEMYRYDKHADTLAFAEIGGFTTPGLVESTRRIQVADIQATTKRDDNGWGSHRSPSRGTKSMLGAILLLTLGGSAILAFNKYSESRNADLKALSKEELVFKMTDRTQSHKVRSAFGSKLVASGRLHAFKATQIPDGDHSMHSQAVSNAIEGAQTWWRHRDDTTLMILYNPTPIEINGLRLNIYTGQCNVAADTTVAVVDYQLSTSLRSADLVAYSLDGLLTNEIVARQGKKPTCIDVVSTW